MKLNTQQIDSITEQTEAVPIPADSPVMETLTEVFGEHTFYADINGLHVLEALQEAEADDSSAEVVRVADWADEAKESLVPIQPVRTGTVLRLAAG